MTCRATSLSKHFVNTDVRAMGLKLFRLLLAGVFGAGLMMADFRQARMLALVRDGSKILVKISKS